MKTTFLLKEMYLFKSWLYLLAVITNVSDGKLPSAKGKFGISYCLKRVVLKLVVHDSQYIPMFN